MAGKSHWVNVIHPDDQAYADRHWRRSIDAEFRLRALTEATADPIYARYRFETKWPDRKCIGININIDLRNQAEAALKSGSPCYRLRVVPRLPQLRLHIGDRRVNAADLGLVFETGTVDLGLVVACFRRVHAREPLLDVLLAPACSCASLSNTRFW